MLALPSLLKSLLQHLCRAIQLDDEARGAYLGLEVWKLLREEAIKGDRCRREHRSRTSHRGKHFGDRLLAVILSVRSKETARLGGAVGVPSGDVVEAESSLQLATQSRLSRPRRAEEEHKEAARARVRGNHILEDPRVHGALQVMALCSSRTDLRGRQSHGVNIVLDHCNSPSHVGWYMYRFVTASAGEHQEARTGGENAFAFALALGPAASDGLLKRVLAKELIHLGIASSLNQVPCSLTDILAVQPPHAPGLFPRKLHQPDAIIHF
mmetsp:Transcript_64998/g.155220  ORF Transcript_64998/g.155220 Transcript_64998/m.155220 type:complete len:268 (-) Transcript_64998:365-1168(-)